MSICSPKHVQRTTFYFATSWASYSAPISSRNAAAEFGAFIISECFSGKILDKNWQNPVANGQNPDEKCQNRHDTWKNSDQNWEPRSKWSFRRVFKRTYEGIGTIRCSESGNECDKFYIAEIVCSRSLGQRSTAASPPNDGIYRCDRSAIAEFWSHAL